MSFIKAESSAVAVPVARGSWEVPSRSIAKSTLMRCRVKRKRARMRVFP